MTYSQKIKRRSSELRDKLEEVGCDPDVTFVTKSGIKGCQFGVSVEGQECSDMVKKAVDVLGMEVDTVLEHKNRRAYHIKDHQIVNKDLYHSYEPSESEK